METNTNKASRSKEEVKAFLSKGFGPLIKKVICQPLELNQEFRQPDASVKATVLILIAGILYMLLPYLFVGDSRAFLGFAFFLRIGLTVMIALVLIGFFVWCIKKIYHKDTSFQQELFTGGLCAVPMIILLLLTCIISLFSGGYVFGNFSMFFGNSIGTLFNVYGFFLMITICFQSLRSVYIKANTAWYLSPLTVLLSFYIAFKLVYAI